MRPWDTGSIGAACRSVIGTSTTTSKRAALCSMAARAAQSLEFPFSFETTSNRAIQDPRATKNRTHHVLVVHPASRLRLSLYGAVEGSCLCAWEQGHDASVAGPDGR